MNNIQRALTKQREFFCSGGTKSVSFRIEQLKKLKKAIQQNEKLILDALKADLNKSAFEAYETEVGIVLEEISFTIKHLKSWAKPKKVRTPISHFLSSSYIYPEPYGVTLNISPWNYPFQLCIAPLIGSIAAGNCSMLKPAKYSLNTTEAIKKIIEENFDEKYIAVVEPYGGRESIQALLNEKFDYIFFTGSVPVGKVIMEGAAKHLTPVTLELGGKSPCIVDKDADIKLAAKRIVWGKFLNAGQTCVAPDYLLVHSSVKDELLKEMKNYITEFYGQDPSKSEDFPRIITDSQFDRLVGLLNKGEIIVGGKHNKKDRYIAPTIIDKVTFDDPIMGEEIFGPIMPVIEFNDLSEIINIIVNRPKPLALYFFSKDKEKQERIIGSTSSGGVCINETIMHVASSYVPFGGVGESGMGAYHGKASFDIFSHGKGVIKKSNLIDIPLIYPPYKDKLGKLKKLLK